MGFKWVNEFYIPNLIIPTPNPPKLAHLPPLVTLVSPRIVGLSPIKVAFRFEKKLRLCLVIVFVFYFQKLIFRNIMKKQFSCIFEIKNMFD